MPVYNASTVHVVNASQCAGTISPLHI